MLALVLIFVWQTQIDDFSVHVQVTWRLWNYHPLTLHDTRLGIPLDRRITHLAPQLTAAMRKEARPNAFSGQQPWQWLVLFIPWLRFTSFVRSFGKKIKWARVHCFRPNQIASRHTTASVKTTNSRRTAMKHHQSISHQQFGRGVFDIKHFRPHQLK